MKHEDELPNSRCGPALLSRRDNSSNTSIDVSKLALVGLQTELCHILRDDDLGPHLPHSLTRCRRSSCVAEPSHSACRMSCGSVQVLPAVCVRVDFTALFAVRDAPGCHRHFIALPQQGTLRAAYTRSCQRCTRLSKQHPGVSEWARITSCASKPHAQVHKLRIRIGESSSLSLSKPKNCWLVADMIWSAVSGAKMLEYAELWLILRMLKQCVAPRHDAPIEKAVQRVFAPTSSRNRPRN